MQHSRDLESDSHVTIPVTCPISSNTNSTIKTEAEDLENNEESYMNFTLDLESYSRHDSHDLS